MKLINIGKGVLILFYHYQYILLLLIFTAFIKFINVNNIINYFINFHGKNRVATLNFQTFFLNESLHFRKNKIPHMKIEIDVIFDSIFKFMKIIKVAKEKLLILKFNRMFMKCLKCYTENFKQI